MKLFARDALLPGGWAADVEIDIDAAGVIERVCTGAEAGQAEIVGGPLIPGMPNLHSHAFQRALAGRTGRAGPDGDSFWTWRQAMYGLLERVDADAFEAITTEAYIEMAQAGYTSVAEFHYVHHDPAGHPYADPAELSLRVIAAAREAGIALTLLPVFYAHSGFDAAPPLPGQRRFLHTTEGYRRLQVRLAQVGRGAGIVVGAAPHSLRAVTGGELREVVGAASGPLHIHAAEQLQEVEQCVAATGLRPVEWLLEHADIDDRWCVVHATHLAPDEIVRLAASGAVAGLAPTTEADLGDGVFAADAFLRVGGRFGVGSDSNTVIDPFAELRQLEWSQRLLHQRRNVLAMAAAPQTAATIGSGLWARAAQGGAQALGQRVGVIAAGNRADIVVLDPEDPAQVGQPAVDVLDAAIFGPARRPVKDVMAGGAWIVRDGAHLRAPQAIKRYRAALVTVFG